MNRDAWARLSVKDPVVDMVTVFIENSYACGHESVDTVVVPAPPSAEERELENWWSDTVHDLTGDEHPCGRSEHAIYEVEIIEAPGRPELVGLTAGWEG